MESLVLINSGPLLLNTAILDQIIIIVVCMCVGQRTPWWALYLSFYCVGPGCPMQVISQNHLILLVSKFLLS